MEINATRFGFVGDARRLAEILAVANKHKITQGITPEKVCAIFKDLGVAFIKIGQLMSLHPEVLPIEYCEALKDLRTDAPSISAAQIRDIISDEFGRPWNTIFTRIKGIPEGSASIAQVHEAYLLDGTKVAVKVQRPDTYQIMEQDTRLFKRALNVMKLTELQDKMWMFTNVIDETWRVAQQEMDFLKEADNIDRMAKIMEPMAFATVPGVYHDLNTKNVLVMEFIDGIELTDRDRLIAAGYDMDEIVSKLVRSYIKQWAEDRFFQADPHPGNIRIRDGQIVWLDLGMTGELTQTEADALHHCMHAILKNDIDELIEWGMILLDMSEYAGNTQMINDFKAIATGLLDKYRVMTIRDINSSSEVIDDVFDVMKQFYINVPLNMNMYGRSLIVIEGTVSDLDDNINLVQILGTHLAAYAIGPGKAGEIARKLSHRKLISGKPLKHADYQETDEDPSDKELLSEEEYDLLIQSEKGDKVITE